MPRSHFSMAVGLAACLLGYAISASGAGFAIIESSVSGLGNAFAGGAASAEDATTIFFNPAGMTRIEGTQSVGAFHLVRPSLKFDNEDSTVTVAGAGSQRIRVHDTFFGGVPETGTITPQTTMRLDFGGGYWLFRNQQYGAPVPAFAAPFWTGAAVVAEAHYSGSLESADHADVLGTRVQNPLETFTC